MVQGEHELRRLDWEVEDDEAVDELVVSGQMEEARKYFEEKKATSVPVYRETLRYYWTQTGAHSHPRHAPCAARVALSEPLAA